MRIDNMYILMSLLMYFETSYRQYKNRDVVWKLPWCNASFQINYQASQLRGYLAKRLSNQIRCSNYVVYWSNLKHALQSKGKILNTLNIGYQWIKGPRYLHSGSVHIFPPSPLSFYHISLLNNGVFMRIRSEIWVRYPRWKVCGTITHTCSIWDTYWYPWSTSVACQKARWSVIGVS